MFAQSGILQTIMNFTSSIFAIATASLAFTAVTAALLANPITPRGSTAPAGSGSSSDAGGLLAVAESAKPFKDVNSEQFDKLRQDKNSVVLDVRTKREFDEGHIPGAINIDVNSADFEEKVAKLDKSKTYLVHCAAGVRSAKACNKLAPLNFKNLYNLEGGLNAWKKAGKPVEK